MDHLQHRKEKNACDVQCNRSHESVREVINIELCMYLFMSVLSFQTRNYGSRSLRSHSCSFWDTISSFVLFSFSSLHLLPCSFSANHAAVCHVIFRHASFQLTLPNIHRCCSDGTCPADRPDLVLSRFDSAFDHHCQSDSTSEWTSQSCPTASCSTSQGTRDLRL